MVNYKSPALFAALCLIGAAVGSYSEAKISHTQTIDKAYVRSLFRRMNQNIKRVSNGIKADGIEVDVVSFIEESEGASSLNSLSMHMFGDWAPASEGTHSGESESAGHHARRRAHTSPQHHNPTHHAQAAHDATEESHDIPRFAGVNAALNDAATVQDRGSFWTLPQFNSGMMSPPVPQPGMPPYGNPSPGGQPPNYPSGYNSYPGGPAPFPPGPGTYDPYDFNPTGSNPIQNFGQTALLANLASGKNPDTDQAMKLAMLNSYIPGYGLSGGLQSAAIINALTGSGGSGGAAKSGGSSSPASSSSSSTSGSTGGTPDNTMLSLLLASLSHSPSSTAALASLAMANAGGKGGSASTLPLLAAALMHGDRGYVGVGGAPSAPGLDPLLLTLLANQAKASSGQAGGDSKSTSGASGASGSSGSSSDKSAAPTKGGLDPMLLAALAMSRPYGAPSEPSATGASQSPAAMDPMALAMLLQQQSAGSGATGGIGGIDPMMLAAFTGSNQAAGGPAGISPLFWSSMIMGQKEAAVPPPYFLVAALNDGARNSLPPEFWAALAASNSAGAQATTPAAGKTGAGTPATGAKDTGSKDTGAKGSGAAGAASTSGPNALLSQMLWIAAMSGGKGLPPSYWNMLKGVNDAAASSTTAAGGADNTQNWLPYLLVAMSQNAATSTGGVSGYPAGGLTGAQLASGFPPGSLMVPAPFPGSGGASPRVAPPVSRVSPATSIAV